MITQAGPRAGRINPLPVMFKKESMNNLERLQRNQERWNKIVHKLKNKYNKAVAARGKNWEEMQRELMRKDENGEYFYQNEKV